MAAGQVNKKANSLQIYISKNVIGWHNVSLWYFDEI